MKCSPWSLFEDSCDKYINNIMLIHNQTEITYFQAYEKVMYITRLISELEFKVAGFYLPNGPEFIHCMLAMNREKKPVVFLSYQFKGDVLSEMINYSDIEVLVTDENGYKEINKNIENINIKAILIHKGGEDFEVIRFVDSENKDISGFKENVFGICFTSGSTTRPKGIVLSSEAIAGNALAVAEYLKFTCEDRTLIPRSFAQASPISGDILMAISQGGSIISLNDLFHPAIFLKAVEEYKATNIFMIRTMLSQVLNYPQLSNYDISSLKRIMLGGMINPKNIFKEAETKLTGVSLYNAYGISEASARVTFASPEELKEFPGTIGRPMSGCEIKIYNENKIEAKANEVGEIYVISDYVMEGYYKQEKLSEEALTPLGLRTRDTGYKDDNGLLYVVGRSDDLIIQGGNKVYPIDVEEVLLKHPTVAEVVVMGIEDEKLGKRIVALLSLKPECMVEVQELYRFCRQNLEDKKVPKEIHILEKIPRNIIGKISKNDLKNYYEINLQNGGNKNGEK